MGISISMLKVLKRKEPSLNPFVLDDAEAVVNRESRHPVNARPFSAGNMRLIETETVAAGNDGTRFELDSSADPSID